jgi:hypothetical protein
MSKYNYDPEWEEKRRIMSIWYSYEKYMDGKISEESYMRILDSNYDILELEQMKEVDKWKKRKDEERDGKIAKKKREKIAREMQDQKATEKAAVYFFAIIILAVIAYNLFFRKP